MKTNLKVGDTFEVVEVLTEGGYDNRFKIGGWTIGIPEDRIHYCLCNEHKLPSKTILSMWTGKECKPVGRLVVTKVK
jgi:hypothetical protein